MIKFSLNCDRGHGFESWFQNSEGFERLRKKRLIACPHCGSETVDKALMTPQLARRNRALDKPVTALPPEEAALRKTLQDLHDYVTENADCVGDQFAEEARKIHYGEAARRAIYGRATLSEARDILEEGIEIFPLPDLPKAKN